MEPRGRRNCKRKYWPSPVKVAQESARAICLPAAAARAKMRGGFRLAFIFFLLRRLLKRETREGLLLPRWESSRYGNDKRVSRNSHIFPFESHILQSCIRITYTIDCIPRYTIPGFKFTNLAGLLIQLWPLLPSYFPLFLFAFYSTGGSSTRCLCSLHLITKSSYYLPNYCIIIAV